MSNELVKKEEQTNSVSNMFTDIRAFEVAAKMANALAQSTIVPKEYQKNASNVLIAIEVASRLRTSPLMIMQNLYVINGRPSWSSSFLSAMINGSGKFKSNIQYEMVDENKTTMKCRAYVKDDKNDMLYGPWISMDMAKKEGWLDKSGSKWKTMPEVMIRYRAASFFARLHCSDLTMGFYTKDEVIEGVDYEVIDEQNVKNTVKDNANKQEIDIKNDSKKDDNPQNIDLETGEILEDNFPEAPKQTVNSEDEEFPQIEF